MNGPSVNPSGRVDIALQRILETGVGMSGDMALQMLYTRYKGQIDQNITAVVGPGTGVGRKGREMARAVGEISRAVTQAATMHGRPPGGEAA